MHAAEGIDPGALAHSAGAGLRLTEPGDALKLGVIGVLAVITIPAGVHVIARAAWRAGTELSDATVCDEASQARLDER